MSRTLLRSLQRNRNEPTIQLRVLMQDLGKRSFGWAVILFSLINLVPLPIGSTLVTAIPLVIVAAQMMYGLNALWLPAIIYNRPIRKRTIRHVLVRLRPLLKPLEQRIKPRETWLFEGTVERVVGGLMLANALALFLPIPLSGTLCALGLLITGLGLVERDGYVALIGLAVGLFSVGVTVAVATVLYIGVHVGGG